MKRIKNFSINIKTLSSNSEANENEILLTITLDRHPNEVYYFTYNPLFFELLYLSTPYIKDNKHRRLHIKKTVNGVTYNFPITHLACACYSGVIRSTETWLEDLLSFRKDFKLGITDNHIEHTDGNIYNNTKNNLSQMSGIVNKRKGTIIGRFIHNFDIVTAYYNNEWLVAIKGIYTFRDMFNDSKNYTEKEKSDKNLVNADFSVREMSFYYKCKNENEFNECLKNLYNADWKYLKNYHKKNKRFSPKHIFKKYKKQHVSTEDNIIKQIKLVNSVDSLPFKDYSECKKI